MVKLMKGVDYSVIHSIQRFEERYGKKISEKEYAELVEIVKKMISKNENIVGKMKQGDKNIQYVLKFHYDGIYIMPTFETERDTITTFLPIITKVDKFSKTLVQK